MAQRKSLAWTELRVGLLVIASFVLLALAIFFISGESGIFTPKYTITVFFPSANGLRPGAEIWLEGVTVGNVKNVRISTQADPNKSVEVDLTIEKRFQNIVRTDSQVTIGNISLLGDKNVEVSRGSAAGQVVPDGGTLQGEEAGDIKKIVTGTNDFLANLDVLSDQFKRMADRVDRGEGTLGKLLTDTAIYDNFNKTAEELHALVRDARTGNGTIGKFMTDDALYTKLTATMDRMNNLLDQIDSGQGTLGKFLKDPSLYNRADLLVARMQSIADQIDSGQGTLGKFIRDDGFYNDSRQTLQRVQTLVSSVENGEGSVGKFMRDPTFYNSLNQASSEIMKLLYDFRQNPKKFLTINFKLF